MIDNNPVLCTRIDTSLLPEKDQFAWCRDINSAWLIEREGPYEAPFHCAIDVYRAFDTTFMHWRSKSQCKFSRQLEQIGQDCLDFIDVNLRLSEGGRYRSGDNDRLTHSGDVDVTDMMQAVVSAVHTESLVCLVVSGLRGIK